MTALPSFENPPVSEVVFGVQFDSLLSLKAAHLGAYWSTIKTEYPNLQDVPPLQPIIDPYKNRESAKAVGIQLSNVPPLPRVFFIDDDGARLIQLQRDRFHHNWRKKEDPDVYPRYGEVKAEFLKQYDGFCGFVDSEGIGTIQPTQYELTYINHVYIGTLWLNLLDLKDLMPPLAWIQPEDSFLPVPDSVVSAYTFLCEPCAGHLTISVSNATRRTDGQELLVLELTIRGFDSTIAIGEWFGRARDWIVRGFTSLTSQSAHLHWRRTS